MTEKNFNWQYPRIVAHRGAGKVAPENTLAALRLGAQLGYKMAEIDATLSQDRVAFLLHDSTLNRTTNGKGAAAHTNWADLSLLDAGSWRHAIYAGEPLCSLATLARFCITNQNCINIEIKPSNGLEHETGQLIALEADKLWQGCEIPPLLSSFSVPALHAAKAAAPHLPRALLCETLPANWQALCSELEVIALDIHYSQITEALVHSVHDQGLKFITWTVNDVDKVTQFFDWGVDCIITDNIQEMTQFI